MTLRDLTFSASAGCFLLGWITTSAALAFLALAFSAADLFAGEEDERSAPDRPPSLWERIPWGRLAWGAALGLYAVLSAVAFVAAWWIAVYGGSLTGCAFMLAVGVLNAVCVWCNRGLVTGRWS